MYGSRFASCILVDYSLKNVSSKQLLKSDTAAITPWVAWLHSRNPDGEQSQNVLSHLLLAS
jgi:hypothetical protein